MFCRYCGNELPDDAKFCNNCGAIVDIEQQEPENIPKPPEVKSTTVKPFAASYSGKNSGPKIDSKKIAVGVVVALAVIVLGSFGLRAVNEHSMKQRIAQRIFEDSRERIVAHYDEVLPYPYDHDMGYGYGCMYDTFTLTPGTDSKTFHVTGYLSVKNMTGRFDDYSIFVEGTVIPNFLRTDWSAEWTLTYEDPEYSDPVSENSPNYSDNYAEEDVGYNADPNLSALPISRDYPFGYYEKNDGEGIEITYISDDDSISFGFFEAQGWYHGGQWMEPNFMVSSDWFDITSDTWNLSVDGVNIQFFIYDSHITVNASSSLGGMSADAISGNYYCLEQAMDIQ